MSRRARRPQVDLRRSSLLRTGVGAALLVAFVGLWAAFAPSQLGGSATYVSTFGTSMNPMLHKGDLVLVKPESDYHVGQVVAYHSDSLHTVVLHRIVNRDGDRYVFKGDNNTWLDTDHPTKAQLIGSMQLMLPGMGDKLALLHTPLGMGSAAAAVVVPFFGVRKRKTKLAAPELKPAQPSRPPNPTRPGIESFTLFAQTPKGRTMIGLALGALLVAGFAWTRSPQQPQTSDVTFDEHGAFAYTADVPDASDVYDGGRVTTGQPIYTSLVDGFDVGFDYTVGASRPLVVNGTTRLDLVVSDSTGWSRSVALAPDTPFSGETVHLGGAVSLSAIRNLITATEARTGVTHDSYTVSVHPVVQRQVQLGASSSNETFAPTLDLRLDEHVLALADGSHDKVTPSKGGLLSAERKVPSSTSLLFLTMDVEMLRRLSVFFALALVVALGAEYRRFGDDSKSDDVAVMTALGAVVVPVAAIGTATDQVISVDSQRDLVLLSQALNVPVLRLTDGSGSFVVVDGTTTYRYRRPAGPHAPSRPRRREPLRAR